MVRCVEQNVADFVFMSIIPTYPSAKYGYVVSQVEVSEGSEEFQMVSRFTEKPTVEVAEEFLKQNAIWNGGVFAFCLGYMMNIVKKYITSDNFEDNRARYSEFPKISSLSTMR